MPLLNQRITELTENTTPAPDDYVPHVDRSDTTMAISGTTKFIKILNLLKRVFLSDDTELAWGAVDDGQFVKRSGADLVGASLAATDIPANLKLKTIVFIFDGGGSVIATGVHGDIPIHFNGTIQSAELYADQSGSIEIDVWKDVKANFPPTDADSITAAAPPTLSSDDFSEDSTLTGWATALSAGDVLRFNVDSVTTIQHATLALKVLAS